jgi:DNA mismatch repair protein MutS
MARALAAWRWAAAGRATWAPARRLATARRSAGLFARPRPAGQPAAGGRPGAGASTSPTPGPGGLPRPAGRRPGPDLPALARDGGFVAEGVRPELDQARACATTARRVIAGPGGAAGRRERRGPEDPPQRRAGLFRRDHRQGGRAAAQAARSTGRSSTARPWPTRCRFTTVGAGRAGREDRPGGRPRPGHRARHLRGLARGGHRRGAAIQAAAQAPARPSMSPPALAEWADDVGAPAAGRDRSTAFEAEAARHPVVEARCSGPGEPFTPNDCRLDGQGWWGAAFHRHRAEHGRQVDLPAPERAAGRAGPGRLLRAGGSSAAGRGRPAVQPGGGGRRPRRGRSTFMRRWWRPPPS